MKPQAKITEAEKLIQNGMRELRTCAEAAADSARNLVNRALAHRPKLLSDATIVNEIAMLLQHASQNLQYTTIPITLEIPTALPHHTSPSTNA